MPHHFIGKKVCIKTEGGDFYGRLTAFNKEDGKIIVEDSYNISKELDLLKVNEVKLLESQFGDFQVNKNHEPLSEEKMYELFDDAFNVYGPFEDSFCTIISLALKKFIKDIVSAKIKIIIGSDDVFGRIGLCFASLLIGRVADLDVEIKCTVKNVKTLKYLNAYENSGGSIKENESSAKSSYSLILFAANRNFDFNIDNSVSNHVLILDIPKKVNFLFTGLGLGFKPENYKTCTRFYYLVDAGYPSFLCNKYNIPMYFKNSLVKEIIE